MAIARQSIPAPFSYSLDFSSKIAILETLVLTFSLNFFLKHVAFLLRFE